MKVTLTIHHMHVQRCWENAAYPAAPSLSSMQVSEPLLGACLDVGGGLVAPHEPEGSKYPNVSYPQSNPQNNKITIPDSETLNTLYSGTLEP